MPLDRLGLGKRGVPRDDRINESGTARKTAYSESDGSGSARIASSQRRRGR